MPLVLLAILKRIGAWLGSLNLWQLLCIGLALFAGIQTMRVWAEQRHSAKVESQLTKCNSARRADRLAYERAQADAQAINQHQIQRTKQKQEAITDEVRTDLNSRLERLRRELRSPAPQSAPKGPGAGQASPAPGGASPKAGLCLSPSELLRAAENEERHDQLITWIERQSQVDPNK